MTTDPMNTTPTPTEPHHDAVALAQRLDVLSYDLMVGGQDNAYRSTLALSGIPDMRRAANLLRDLAAASAAAPDERLCYSDECGEPCQSWQAMKRAEIEHLRRENATIAQRLGEARAALAARPARGVSTADVDAREALRERIAAVVDAVTRLEVAMDAVLAVLGFTVADEGRA